MLAFSLLGLGYTSDTPCDQIPPGDSYRDVLNYCAVPGGHYQFAADGSIDTDSFVPSQAAPSTPAGVPAGGQIAPRAASTTKWWIAGALVVAAGLGAYALGRSRSRANP